MNWIGLKTFVSREVRRMMRVPTQTLVAPWISAFLFIFVFGSIIGDRIGEINGVPYIVFVLPGVLMMNVITSSFAHSSSSLYFARFTRSIEEVLVAPLSHIEMILGYVIGAVARGFIVATGIVAVGMALGGVQMEHFVIFVFYVAAVSVAFGLLGMLVALWAQGFEQLNILSTFLIMPLSFLGGVFNSIQMLPEYIQPVAYLNPFFYFIDGLRYSMTGIHDANILFGMGFVVLLIFVMGFLVWKLFEKGWRLRV